MKLTRNIVVTSALPSLLLVACPLKAQTAIDSVNVDSEASRILDDPGGTDVDPDELFEYLDETGTPIRKTIRGLHSIPDVSWIRAHRALREGRFKRSSLSDSSSHFFLRSRMSSAFDPNAQHGFQSSQYLGSPSAFYNRVKASSPILDVAIVQQKKSWEPQLTDRLNGYGSLRNPETIIGALTLNRAVAGDYALAFGNGLLFGGGASSAKSMNALNAVESRAFGIRGTLSNYPAHSFRGGALELRAGLAGLSVFASDRFIDANIQDDTIQTLYATTYHRTASELALKNTAEMRTVGLHGRISNQDTSDLFLSAGVTAFESSYDNPFTGTLSAPFSGTSVQAGSVDFLAVGNRVSVTGEAALSANDTSIRSAWILSCITQPSSLFGLSMLYHHIPYGFVSPFGELSGDAISTLANANGMYLGFQLTSIEKALRINAYADFQNTLLPITDLFGKQKRDYLAASYLTLLEGALDLRLIVRSVENENLATIQGAERSVSETVITDKTTIRLEANYGISENLSLKSRIEHLGVTSSPSPSEQGFLVMQEIRANILPFQTRVGVSATRFLTDSFNSAMYLYEASVPGTGAVALLDGKGWRFGLRLVTQILPGLAISFAATGAVFDQERTIGSGATARTGTTDFSGAGQVDFSF